MKKSSFFLLSKKVNLFLNLLGINLRALPIFIKGFLPYLNDYIKFKHQYKSIYGNSVENISFYPILLDKFDESGIASGHYFHQDLLIAKKIYKKQPTKHVDLGSRVDGFVAHVAVFREIEVIDIRSQDSVVENIKFIQADLMKLDEKLIDYCDSFSSLHALEHFGLGRYGDPIDVDGHIKAINNIYIILKKDGIFYFSTPIGQQRIEFNAHRVFDVSYLLKLFNNKFKVESFSFVDGNGDLNMNVEMSDEAILNNFNCWWGCGIFELRKI